MTREPTKCIRCDTAVLTEPKHGLTLTFAHGAAAVKLCEDCKEIAHDRDYF